MAEIQRLTCMSTTNLVTDLCNITLASPTGSTGFDNNV